MTESNETNEEVNEELSTDDLKGVSGGVVSDGTAGWNWAVSPDETQGSGSGMTLKDWKNSRQGVVDTNDCPQ